MNLLCSHVLSCALLLVILEQAHCFSTHPSFTRVKGYRSSFQSSNDIRSPVLLYAAKKGSSKKGSVSSGSSRTTTDGKTRSRVIDPTGPTHIEEELEPEVIALKDIPELQYDPDAHPIAHQPWRRGETNGCEDPIDAEWRVKAEEIIKTAAHMVGGTVLDVTWYLTSCLVTIDETKLMDVMRDALKSHGPVVEVVKPEGAIFKDPDDPNPEAIWADDEAVPIYERDEEAEFDLKRQMYARKADDEEELELGDDDDVPLYTAQETRGDNALRVAEEMENRAGNEETTGDTIRSWALDTQRLSTIAGAILDALESAEEEVKVLTRHTITLSSPGSPYVLETQSQFDAHRGFEIIVETQDPWESNRTLKGTLVDRNSMDVILNQKGRMVTVPLNFVRCVRLKQAASNKQEYDEVEDAANDKERVEADDDADEGEVEYEDGEIDYEDGEIDYEE
jgi:ribosome maturation factor RimP